jgi:hypothetical protein
MMYYMWKVDHIGLATRLVKPLDGERPGTQWAHAPAAPDTKPDHYLHGGWWTGQMWAYSYKNHSESNFGIY